MGYLTPSIVIWAPSVSVHEEAQLTTEPREKSPTISIMTREGVVMGEYKVSHMQDSRIQAIVQCWIPFHVHKEKWCSLRKGMNS